MMLESRHSHRHRHGHRHTTKHPDQCPEGDDQVTNSPRRLVTSISEEMRDRPGDPSPRRRRNEPIQIVVDIEMPAGPVHPGLGGRMRMHLRHPAVIESASCQHR